MGNGVASAIVEAEPRLRPSERKVAAAVMRDPEEAVHRTMASLAAAAGVSEPTVVRFCHALGYSGYQQFRVELARSLGTGMPYVHRTVDFADDISTQIDKVLGSAQWAISVLRARLPRDAVAAAVDLLAAARRIEFHGSGASGIVALDAQNKFFRLNVPTIAHTDPHQQLIGAASLRPGEVLVIFSQTGRTRDLVTAARIARGQGADVIGVTHAGSPVARAASLTIAMPEIEDPELYTPMASRIAVLAVVDMLATGVATRRGPEFVAHLKRLHDSLAHLRSART